MTLNQAKKNTLCCVVDCNTSDQSLKLRLYEIGFFVGAKVKILSYSLGRKTLLVKVLDSCFAIKNNIASVIEVKYE
mgnify:CR=1 FL=1